MPIFRYFVFVGGALLALLFVADYVLPSQPVHAAIVTASNDQPLIRIRSDRHLPERVVLDTSQPTHCRTRSEDRRVVAPQPPVQELSPELAEMSAKARVRETFAQFSRPRGQCRCGQEDRGQAASSGAGSDSSGAAPSDPGSAQAQGRQGAPGAATGPADDVSRSSPISALQHDLVRAPPTVSNRDGEGFLLVNLSANSNPSERRPVRWLASSDPGFSVRPNTRAGRS